MNDYQAKFVTPEQAVKAVQSGDWVDYGFGAGFPELLDRALAARKGEVKDVKVRGGLVIRPRIEIVESDPEQESFTYYSWHIGDYERKLQARGLVKFMPVMLCARRVSLPRQSISSATWRSCRSPSRTRRAIAASASRRMRGARSLRARGRSF